MFYLCTVKATDMSTVFGGMSYETNEFIPPKYENLKVIMIGQKPDCSGFMLLSNTVVEELTQHSSVPNGYDFTFRQAWGLTINEEIIHRVISTLRSEEYPPMAEYLDAKVKGDTAQEQKYIDDCLIVKEKYPKFSW